MIKEALSITLLPRDSDIRKGLFAGFLMGLSFLSPSWEPRSFASDMFTQVSAKAAFPAQNTPTITRSALRTPHQELFITP